jgi:hypothetical protein
VRDADDIVNALASIEERLRELAYERLRAAAEDGDAEAVEEERRLQRARRAVERAIHALGGSPEV